MEILFIFLAFIISNIACVDDEKIFNEGNYPHGAMFTLYKRNKHGRFIEEISISDVPSSREDAFMLEIEARPHFSLEIHRNTKLINSRYEAYKKKQSIPDFNCHFTGNSKDGLSSGSISMCSGISGVVSSGENIWKIHSENSGVGNITRLGNDQSGSHCGVNHAHEPKRSSAKITEDAMSARSPKKSEESSNHGNGTHKETTQIHWRRYVEVWLVIDRSLYEYLDSDEHKVHRTCTEIINIANTIYKPLLVSLVLVGVEIWKTRNKIRVQPDYKQLLTDFQPHRENLINSRKYHDYTILLTALDLALAGDYNKNVVGYANVREMCSDSGAVAVVEFQRTDSSILTAGVVAHEMGHGLGAKHDDAFCLAYHGEAGIMSGSSTDKHSWSNCSMAYIAHYIDGFSCLRNSPEFPTNHPFCGNGQVDHGEQCDCGGLSRFCDKCCHANNCTLKNGATCASDDCCDMETCSPKPLGTQCREEFSECDLPEYCSGRSEKCPKDVHKADGTPCGLDQGHCVHGQCGSRDLICKMLINEGAVSPSEKEFRELSRLYSGRNECKDIFCHPLLNIFNGRKSTLKILSAYKYSDTHLILLNQSSRIYPRLNGVPCGDNKICINDRCTPIPEFTSDECVSNCSGNGICNSNQNCHCDPGFAPPMCNTSGFGGSFDSGHATDPSDYNDYELICFYVILWGVPAIVFMCCLWPFLHDQWEKTWKDFMDPIFPTFTSVIDSCCCPCMFFLTKWIRLILKKEEMKDMASSERRYSDTRRPTICEVGVDLLPEKPKLQSWGVADSMLATDIITITPTSSPDTRRKIRLPSDSPILRTRSDEKIYRPPLSQTVSNDSGCLSGDETSSISFNPSMGSLVSIFRKFGRQKSKQTNEEHESPPLLQKSRPPKDSNLRRMVVDPLSNHKLCRQKSTEEEQHQKRHFRRSISEDPSMSRRIEVPKTQKVTFGRGNLSSQESIVQRPTLRPPPTTTYHKIITKDSFSDLSDAYTYLRFSESTATGEEQSERFSCQIPVKNMTLSSIFPCDTFYITMY